MRVRYQGRFTEYVPFKIGFFDESKPVVIKEKRYDYNGLAPSDKTMRAELAAIKKAGYNTIRCGVHPRKTRLYELCAEAGLLIGDEANIDTSLTGTDPAVGGTLANDPAWVEAYVRRAENSWRASRNDTGVILYSLGKGPGVGYNIYKSYLRMKKLEPVRPIVYEAAGELWCNDPISR
jgi:beta-galactosidase